MTWEFKPGMKVVCVNTGIVSPFTEAPGGIKENEIYTLSWVGEAHTEGKPYLGVVLKEIAAETSNPNYKPFMAIRFRPLQTQFTSLLNSIVAGVNDGHLVVEDDRYMDKFKKSRKATSPAASLRSQREKVTVR